VSTTPVTVVINCFNAELSIPRLLANVDELHTNGAVEWRFFFVDDGSTDNTLTLLLQASQGRAWTEVVRHQQTRGVGAAVRTAVINSQSPIICSLDGASRYPLESLYDLTRLIEDGADIASGVGSDTAMGSGEELRISRATRWLLSRAYERMLGCDAATLACTFRAYRRERLTSLLLSAKGPLAPAEIMLRALARGADVRIATQAREVSGESESDARAHARHALYLMLALMLPLAFVSRVRGYLPGSSDSQEARPRESDVISSSQSAPLPAEEDVEKEGDYRPPRGRGPKFATGRSRRDSRVRASNP
jgi:hypothetical protein